MLGLYLKSFYLNENLTAMKSFLLGIGLVISIISHTQRILIGPNSPNPIVPTARLEVIGEGNNSLTNAFVLKNSSGDTMLRVRNDGRMGLLYNGSVYGRTFNLGGNGLNFYLTDPVFSGAIFPTDTSLIMWSQADDLNYVILQPSWGKVGIGTYSPQAKLEVNGTVILGANGTLINNVIKVTVSKNLASIPANSASIETFAVPGAAIGSSVSLSPATALADGLLIAYARVSVAGTVEAKFMNVTAAAINPLTMNFFISVVE